MSILFLHRSQTNTCMMHRREDSKRVHMKCMSARGTRKGVGQRDGEAASAWQSSHPNTSKLTAADLNQFKGWARPEHSHSLRANFKGTEDTMDSPKILSRTTVSLNDAFSAPFDPSETWLSNGPCKHDCHFFFKEFLVF